MNVKLLIEHHLKFLSLKEGCTGSSESTLVKMPHCWNSHVTDQILVVFFYEILCPNHRVETIDGLLIF